MDFNPSTSPFNDSEKKYLSILNSELLDPQSIPFSMHVNEGHVEKGVLWKIVHYQANDSSYAKAHRNALLLLHAQGETLSASNLANTHAPLLEFSRPVSLEKADLSDGCFPFINLTGACLRGADLTRTILVGAQLGVYILRHSKNIQCMAIFRNYIASVSTAQTLHFWDYQKGILLDQKERLKRVKTSHIIFSSNGELLFVIERKSRKAKLITWKCNPLQKKHSVTLDNHNIAHLACTADGRFVIVTFNSDSDFESQIWEITANVSLQLKFKYLFGYPIEHFCVSPTYSICACSRQKANNNSLEIASEIKFLDIETMGIKATWMETCAIESLSFASDGKSLVITEKESAGQERKAYTRTLETSRRFDLFSDAQILNTTFGPSTSLFAYSTDPLQICVRSVYDRRILSRLKVPGGVQKLFLSDSEKELIAFQENAILVWKISEISKLWKSEFVGIDDVQFCYSTTQIYALCSSKFQLLRYSVLTGTALTQAIPESFQNLLGFAKRCALGSGGDTIICENLKNHLCLYSVSQEKIYWEEPYNDIAQYALSPNGNYIVLFRHASMEIWHVQQKRKLKSFPVSIAASPETPPLLACGLNDEGEGFIAIAKAATLQVFDTTKKQEVASKPIARECYSLRFVANNKILVLHQTVNSKLWRMPEFAKIKSSNITKCCEISPKGDFLLSYFFSRKENNPTSSLTGHIVQIVNILQNEVTNPIHEFNVNFAVLGLRIAPNGRYFAIWGKDGCFQLHSLDNGVRRLQWREPVQLEIDQIKTDHLVADEITESMLHYPRVRPRTLAEIKQLIQDCRNSLTLSSPQKVTSVVTTLPSLISNQLEELIKNTSKQLNNTITSEIDLSIFIHIRLLELKIIKNHNLTIILTPELVYSLIYHLFLLKEELEHFDRLFLLKGQISWQNCDRTSLCEAALKQVNSTWATLRTENPRWSTLNKIIDWSDFQYIWIKEFQVSAVNLKNQDFFLRLDVHERMHILDLAALALKKP